MRQSRVLKKLRAGQIVFCTKINLADPRVTEIAAMCGFDCLWLDMEHVPTDWHTIENQIRTAKLYDVDTMVRVARGSYSSYIQPLEADATGIMVPHVMSLEDAKKVVWQTRFYPIGRRAIDGGNQDGAYCMVELQECIKTANEQRFVIVQIEDPEPLDEIEEIANLDGLDMLFFGRTDFSHGIGAPAQWDHPLLIKTRERVAKVARDNGKFAGTPGNLNNYEELINMGYNFISIGADVVGLSSYYNGLVGSQKSS
jgi:4-hydroxy-2-oxoheptanedioate aldolase